MAFNDVVVVAHFDNGFAALTPELVHVHTQVTVLAFGAQHNDAVIVTNLNVIARQLTTEVGRTLARFSAHKCSQGHQEIRVVVRHIFCTETLTIVFCNEARVEVASHKFRVGQQGRLEGNVGADATNDKTIQGFAHFGNGIVAVGTMNN